MHIIRKLTALTAIVSSALVHRAQGLTGVDQAVMTLLKSNASQLNYLTDFTQGINFKQIHSHNDYWRSVPVYEALSYGVASIEADVWLVNGTLYIGHEAAALTTARTFANLYVEPLLKIVNGQNPITKFNPSVTKPNGVFDASGSTPLHLFVDIKTDGVEALPYVLKELAPLREKGYLTTYHGATGELNQSAITVIGTGSSPLPQVVALEPRDYFFDAPLGGLSNTSVVSEWNITISPVASGDYGAIVGWSGIGNISASALANMTAAIDEAHAHGIAARFWDTPGWPIFARNNVWQSLLVNGADWLNADDLEAAASF